MRKVWFATGMVLFAACTGKPEENAEKAEDESTLATMQYLQGIWLDDNTGMPILKVKGDSMYLASQVNAPFRFSISRDTILVYGSEWVAYRISDISENIFRFYTSTGEWVSLHKSDSDTIPFGYRPVAEPERKVIKKDSVVISGGKRYRGYVYINPSTKKVFHPTVTEEGMIVDNVYYDNIIHICVYEGRNRLYSKDVSKEMFEGVVPSGFLRMAILSDMDFMGVSAETYHYQATVSIPDELSYFNIDLLIDKDGNISYKLKE